MHVPQASPGTCVAGQAKLNVTKVDGLAGAIANYASLSSLLGWNTQEVAWPPWNRNVREVTIELGGSRLFWLENIQSKTIVVSMSGNQLIEYNWGHSEVGRNEYAASDKVVLIGTSII